MPSSTEASAPPQKDPAPISTIAVRADHWAAITEFMTAQSVVLNADVPRHIYGLYDQGQRQHKALDIILNKYKFAEDMVEIRVTLDNGEQRKGKDAVMTENRGEVKNGIANNKAAQQPKTTSKIDLKSIEASRSSTKNRVSSDTAKSSDRSSSSEYSGVPKNTNKRSASSSQATAESFEEAGRRAASKPKEELAHLSAVDDSTVPATKIPTQSSLRKNLKRPAGIPLIPPKNPAPDEVTNGQEPKLAARKMSKGINAPERSDHTKSGSLTHNGSHVNQKGNIHRNTSPKSTESASALKPDGAPKPIVERYDILKDKTNNVKASSDREPKPSVVTNMLSQPKKPVIKRKIVAADGTIISVNGKPVIGKHSRPSEETHTNQGDCDKPEL